MKSLDYYRSRFKKICENRIELFGNTGNKQFEKVILPISRVIDKLESDSIESEIKEKLINIILELLLNIINSSGEIYNQEHLQRKEDLLKIIAKIPSINAYFEGSKRQLEFILLKKHLYFLLRKLIPKQDSQMQSSEDEEICKLLEKMRETAGKEKNSFRKTQDGYKIFLAEIDVLYVNYLKKLWKEKNVIEAAKELEKIFIHFRKHISMIQTPKFFYYFINEYTFLINFLKLLIMSQDFEEFSGKTNLDWQKDLFSKIVQQLRMICRLFKYPFDKRVQRKLLIVQESTCGKFMEFIIFYLLREIAFNLAKNKDLREKLSSQNEKVNEILNLIKGIQNPDQDIKWSEKGDNTDIDILIGKNAVFIKTGIISSSDQEKIKNELEIAKTHNYKPFIIIDIGKNLEIAKKIEKKFEGICILDAGEFLKEIYDISKKIGIPLELPYSDIKSFAGFTGG